MKKSAIISSVIFGVVLVLWVVTGFDLNCSKGSTKVDTYKPDVIFVDTASSYNGWSVYATADSGLMTVRYQEKYGNLVESKCKIVFEGETQFKLIAPSLNKTIEKSNLVSLEVLK